MHPRLYGDNVTRITAYWTVRFSSICWFVDLISTINAYPIKTSRYCEDIYKSLLILQKDNYQRTGCYNLQCPGFVQIHPHLHLGIRAGITSTYGGIQYEMDLMIKQVCETIHLLLSSNLISEYVVEEILNAFKALMPTTG